MGRYNKTVYLLGLDLQVKRRIHWHDAVEGLANDTMVLFKGNPDRRVRSADGTIDLPWPEIVQLKFKGDVPRYRRVDLDCHAPREGVLFRDGYTCCYCGQRANTIDHVKPKSRCIRDGDPYEGHTWGNLVAACYDCNNNKGDRTPEEAGMTMLWGPSLEFAAVQLEVWRLLEEGKAYIY